MLVSAPLHAMRRSRGFTTIELLVAIVILGIVMALALPSFKDSIRKSRRSEAFAALSAVQLKQERWRANHTEYASDLASDWPTGLGIQATTANSYYTVSIASQSATGYELTAAAASGTSQAQDGNCSVLGVKMEEKGKLSYGSAAVGGTPTYPDTNRCWTQ